MGDYNNFIIQKGATWNRVVYWNNPDGTPINLSGYSAKFQVSSSFGGSTALELTSGSGITITGASGKIELKATAAQTAALATGHYYYELELSQDSWVTVYRIMEGELYVSPQVKA